MQNIFIIGCGNIGRLVAGKWIEQGVNVTALARSEASALRLQGLGIKTVFGDLDRQQTLTGLPLAGHTLYYFAPPSPQHEGDPRMENLLTAINPQNLPRRIIYISTSGVYGDTGGAWVTEQDDPNPQTARARRRVAAETALRRFGRGQNVAVVILRVGGIYGPGRLPEERLQRGLPVLNEAECGYTNRIHAEDLAHICLTAAEKGKADNIYNVTDGQPGNMTQYFYAVADALGLPRPPNLPMDEAREQLSPAMLSYLTESRRMDNSKLLREFGITLRYPDLQSGLKDIKQFKVTS
ncbi:MAG: SDR family oxidoreductase [Gammaproteobacteria bacterium]|nr:SDR family oxidoreductase [Gammaproteobacteria bacterium]